MNPIASKINANWEWSISAINTTTSLQRKANSRIDYQPLFGKGARVERTPDLREQQKSDLSYQSQSRLSAVSHTAEAFPALFLGYVYFPQVLIGSFVITSKHTNEANEPILLCTDSFTSFFAQPEKTILFLDNCCQKVRVKSEIWL